MNIIKKLFDHEYKELKNFEKIADDITALDEEYSKLSDKKLQNKTVEFKKRLDDGETLDDILVEAFATAREAAYRIIGEKPYYVQLLGGLAIHYGNIAEMKTGEGKTLTEVLPAYLNALSGNGVHIITVNEYLADRDAHWMGKIFEFLGLTVGVNLRELTPKQKQDIYSCDITYSTNNEIGFDYLRDNMVVRREDKVMQRPYNFAIIDEVDSVLIDEARTPLIISGGRLNNANLYVQADSFVKGLTENTDYTIDEKTKAVTLTDVGNDKAQKTFKVKNLYDINNTSLVHHINQALKANYAMKNDVDYVVQDGEVIIVDQFTGRLMKGRAFSEGLHQAIQAKENVTIEQETRTLATITFQNLFRMYAKLAGMTGTAKTEEEEFRNIYNMYVIQIPTNKPIIREDLPDLVYATKKGKYAAILRVIEEIHKTGQPILVGTIAIETNELISKMLTKKKIKHEILNAKNHAREAEIIAKAGEKGAVTIATNMAGRGTDIKLGEGVKELGGLYVIGTERHESRRIDNQLRGRSGRQGDPGTSQFFVSFDDDLMVRFGTEKIKNMMQTVGISEDQAIRSKMFTKSIETAQKRVEGNNYDIRKNLLEYDDVMNQQREIIYDRRNEIIDSESIHEDVLELFKDHITELVNSHIAPEGHLTDNDISEITEAVNTYLVKNNTFNVDLIKDKDVEDIIVIIYEKVIKDYEEKISKLPKEVINDFEKSISLRIIDSMWTNHISTLDHLKEGIGLRGYAQNNPVQAYTKEGFEMFDQMMEAIDKNIAIHLLKARIETNVEQKPKQEKMMTNEDKSTLKKKTPEKKSKIGRNQMCPCGSGKKYKQCCGK